MGFHDHLETFHGKAVVEWSEDTYDEPGTLTDPATQAPRITLVDYHPDPEFDALREVFTALLALPDVERLEALLLGSFDNDGPGPGVSLLCDAAEQLPNLTHLFVGEIIRWENEVSWIQQSDLRELSDAFPLLQSLHVRGTNGLVLGPVTHRHLTTLHLESGGTPLAVLDQITQSELPELTELKVMTGNDWYGWDGSADDVRAFVDRVHETFPKLVRFGLRNMHHTLTDEVATHLAKHPLLDRLDELDLSLGTLGDEGARALLEGGKLGTLSRLDLTHNFISDEQLRTRLHNLPGEVLADRDDAWVDDDYDGDGTPMRFCSIGE